MTKSLLETAKQKIPKQYARPVTQEDIDLALAWLRGEVTPNQIIAAYKTANISYGGNYLYRMATVLREAFRQGALVESPTEPEALPDSQKGV